MDAGMPFRLVDQLPTASQAGELHDTPNRLVIWDPAGFGTDWRLHDVPSHDSASPPVRPWKSFLVPTDVRFVGPEHETA
jgi:hypothetical protein